MQKDTREHESLQLLIKSHFEQRDKLLEAATEARNWIYYQLYKYYGIDYEVYDYNEPAPEFSNVTEVVGGLRKISQTHPTRSVRALTGKIKDDITTHYSSITSYKTDKGAKREYPEIGGKPPEDDLFKWLKDSDALIELMHTPPSLDEVRAVSQDEPPRALP
jgi:hypothetical protein